jgi:chromosome segregation ATPase
VIDRDRVSAELEIRRQNERLQEHRTSVVQDLDSRARRLQQGEQSSAETAQRLEQRLQHVTQMRAELDLQQREILEQRLLLEELQASARQQSLPTRGTAQFEQAQKSVVQFFEKLHHPLRAERDRLEAKFSELASRQEQFRKDREELERWFADQEASLAEKSHDDSGVVEIQMATVEGELAKTRRQWHSDRKESEATIRQLLDELAERESAAFHQPPPRLDDDGEQRVAA